MVPVPGLASMFWPASNKRSEDVQKSSGQTLRWPTLVPLRVGDRAGPWMKLGQTATRSRWCCSASRHASFSASTCAALVARSHNADR